MKVRATDKYEKLNIEDIELKKVPKKGEEWEEYNNAVKWMAVTVILSTLITIILALAAMPLGYLIGTGVSKESLADVSRFFDLVLSKPGYLYSRYWNWFKQLLNYQHQVLNLIHQV